MLQKKMKEKLLSLYTPNVREIHQGLIRIASDSPYQLSKMDYEEYWRCRPSYDMQPRFPIIAQFIEEGTTVLDVGCGDGAMLAYLKKNKDIDELGIDISNVAIERAKQRGVNARVQYLSDLAAESQAFDHVVMSEVIEHVGNPEDFLRWSWGLSRKSLIITFPNIAYWSHRLRLLSGRFPVQWVYHPGEHIRFWSVPDFKHWLKQLNLEETRAEATFVPSNGITLLKLHQALPNLFGNQIVVSINKAN